MSSGDKINLAIFASGGGSNARQICTYFSDHPVINVRLIVCNRKEAGVFTIAPKHNIPALYIPKSKWDQPREVLEHLMEHEITHIVLAGFLLLVPEWLIHQYRGRIINIHPALLPDYGGYGMYGMNVHKKVKEDGQLISGITIHLVDEHYDEGDIIFQKKIELKKEDSAAEIAEKVLELEHYYFPRVIEAWTGQPSDIKLNL